ncbi:MAG TPA: 2-dehydropantoate 2-reductase N-terminal domain-containing protein [Streptosporangiaceae bacterium]|nr:2-dehydropantoate 2-reductase N-terminal domain-containing protein [Streptosporangiaceae bacterium]
MRYVIIGAGAIGGTIGARLHASGHEVILVARGAHHAALRQAGLRFVTPAGAVSFSIPVASGPAEVALQAGDVLIVAVKVQDAAAALDAWAWQPVAGGGVAADSLPVFCAQNGTAGERLALRRFRHVYGMCVWLPATHLEPGVVEAPCAPMTGMLPTGRYPSGLDDTARAVAADLAGSMFLAPVSPDVMRYKYGKLLTNLGNAVQAVCGPEPAAAVAAAAAELRRRAQAEGAAVLEAAGIGYATAAEIDEMRADQVRIEPVNGTRRGGSSWQSLTRGTGSIEADYLNGEVVMIGRVSGIPTPANELLQRLANQFARERRAPGTITAAELAA